MSFPGERRRSGAKKANFTFSRQGKSVWEGKHKQANNYCCKCTTLGAFASISKLPLEHDLVFLAVTKVFDRNKSNDSLLINL